MDGLYYLLINAAICIIVVWYVMNERSQINGPTTGLLAMTDDDIVYASSEPATAFEPDNDLETFRH